MNDTPSRISAACSGGTDPSVCGGGAVCKNERCHELCFDTVDRRGEDIGRADVLERYQQWRRFDTASLALATDAFNRLFSNDNSFLRLVRDLGLGLTNSLPRVRRGFIREAAGLTGDLPRLAQGKPL